MLWLLKWYKIFFVLLLSVVISSLILIVNRGMNWGIDFTGGSVIEVSNEESIDIGFLHQKFMEHNIENYSVQHYGTNDKQIRINVSQDQDVDELRLFVLSLITKGTIERVDFIGPVISQELVNDMMYAVLFAVFSMLVYIWIRFEWQFSLGAVMALIHDVILSLGFISLFQLEFSVSSVAAVLIIIGYSINDTVILYDRIRENLRLYRNINLENVAVNSVVHVLRRTVITSLTTAVALLVLLIFGSHAFFDFVLIILLGVIVGTLSSIFIAMPIIVYLGINRN